MHAFHLLDIDRLVVDAPGALDEAPKHRADLAGRRVDDLEAALSEVGYDESGGRASGSETRTTSWIGSSTVSRKSRAVGEDLKSTE